MAAVAQVPTRPVRAKELGREFLEQVCLHRKHGVDDFTHSVAEGRIGPRILTVMRRNVRVPPVTQTHVGDAEQQRQRETRPRAQACRKSGARDRRPGADAEGLNRVRRERGPAKELKAVVAKPGKRLDLVGAQSWQSACPVAASGVAVDQLFPQRVTLDAAAHATGPDGDQHALSIALLDL